MYEGRSGDGNDWKMKTSASFEREDGEDGENLEYDEDAYDVFRQVNIGMSCLSFDVLLSGGDSGDQVPLNEHSCVELIAGTQSPVASENRVVILRAENLLSPSAEDDDESDDSEGSTSDLKLSINDFIHCGTVNRIKWTLFNHSEYVATWSDEPGIRIWDVTSELSKVRMNISPTNKEKKVGVRKQPVYSGNVHKVEGFALCWSSVRPGLLASGDCNGAIFVHEPRDGGAWVALSSAFLLNNVSVEDLQWSPNEGSILASASCDGHLRIWDARSASRWHPVADVLASNVDLNVISWSSLSPLIISGDDQGWIKVWDIRSMCGENAEPVSFFKHHKRAITSLEFHSKDPSIFAASGEDDLVTLWDMTAEADPNDKDAVLEGVPPQLLFIHKGQMEVKELHWHPRITGLVVTTGIDGFNIFKTVNV